MSFDVVHGFEVTESRRERSACGCRGQARARGRSTRPSLWDPSPRLLPQLQSRGNSIFVDTRQTVDSRTLLAHAPRRKGLLSVQLSRGSTTHHLPRVAGPTGIACQLLLSTRRCIDPPCVRIRCVERFSERSVALHHSRGETNTTRFALSPHGYERVPLPSLPRHANTIYEFED